jgi:hypothetical protein
MGYYWLEGIGVEKYMYIDPLALKGLEEGGLLTYPSRDAQMSTTQQSITGHSLAICLTSLAIALPFVKHHQPQHYHLLNLINHSIVISISPSAYRHLDKSITIL